MANFFKAIGRWIKEWFRRTIVGLKRKPQNIPLVFLAISFIYYSFNLTKVSMATEGCALSPMGLMSFITFLFSILSMVSLLNAFPRREKTKIPMIIVCVVMLVGVFVADIVYGIKIVERIAIGDINESFENAVYFCKDTMLIIHEILIGISIVLILTLPLYSKLLKKINTSIQLEYTEGMNAIEIEED